MRQENDKMIGDNNLILLDVSEISIEDIQILKKAINKINSKKVILRTSWIAEWREELRD